MLRDYVAEVRDALARGERREASRLLDEAIALAEQKAIRIRVALKAFDRDGSEFDCAHNEVESA